MQQVKRIRNIGLFFLCLSFALAQAITGGIFGSVTDSSGAVIPRAEIKLVSVTTGAERTVQTTHSGEFVLDGLEPGEYSLSVKASGFKVLERTGIRLSASERLGLGGLSLQIGAIDQQITVAAEGATVQTASSERSASITAEQTEDLPVYGRTVTSLVGISPGVVDPVGAVGRDLSGSKATDFNVAGNRETANNFSVEGVTLSAVGGAAQWHLHAQHGVDFRGQGFDHELPGGIRPPVGQRCPNGDEIGHPASTTAWACIMAAMRI